MKDQCAPAVSPEKEDTASPQLFGISGLAERWGVTKQRAAVIASKRLGPPWKHLSMGRIWTLDQIVQFERTWKRKSGLHIGP